MLRGVWRHPSPSNLVVVLWRKLIYMKSMWQKGTDGVISTRALLACDAYL